jgi:hypothetical protein
VKKFHDPLPGRDPSVEKHCSILPIRYLRQEDFKHEPVKYEKDIVKNKGMDFYLGHLLKKVEDEKQERIKVSEIKKIEVKKEGDPEALLKNPGMVTYEDLKAYLAEKNKNRLIRDQHVCSNKYHSRSKKLHAKPA